MSQQRMTRRTRVSTKIVDYSEHTDTLNKTPVDMKKFLLYVQLLSVCSVSLHEVCAVVLAESRPPVLQNGKVLVTHQQYFL